MSPCLGCDRYKEKRASLVKERIRLMDLLESQEDLPEKQTLAEYEKNKRQIMDLDDAQEIHVRRDSIEMEFG